MSVDFQAFLFDVLDGELGGSGDSGDSGAVESGSGVRFGSLADEVRRQHLSAGAWVDVRPAWVTGADDLFARLVRDVPWRAERRQMYDRVVDVPRLTRFYGEHDTWPDPTLAEGRDVLSAHYAAELGEPFTSAGLCYYRDGQDSVAWHGDTGGRRGRGGCEDTIVAILSLGEARRLSLRPRAGLAEGSSMSFQAGHGDLIVMGGSCQRTWEHAVLKTARAVGPRISVQFRPYDVR